MGNPQTLWEMLSRLGATSLLSPRDKVAVFLQWAQQGQRAEYLFDELRPIQPHLWPAKIVAYEREELEALQEFELTKCEEGSADSLTKGILITHSGRPLDSDDIWLELLGAIQDMDPFYSPHLPGRAPLVRPPQYGPVGIDATRRDLVYGPPRAPPKPGAEDPRPRATPTPVAARGMNPYLVFQPPPGLDDALMPDVHANSAQPTSQVAATVGPEAPSTGKPPATQAVAPPRVSPSTSATIDEALGAGARPSGVAATVDGTPLLSAGSNSSPSAGTHLGRPTDVPPIGAQQKVDYPGSLAAEWKDWPLHDEKNRGPAQMDEFADSWPEALAAVKYLCFKQPGKKRAPGAAPSQLSQELAFKYWSPLGLGAPYAVLDVGALKFLLKGDEALWEVAMEYIQNSPHEYPHIPRRLRDRRYDRVWSEGFKSALHGFFKHRQKPAAPIDCGLPPLGVRQQRVDMRRACAPPPAHPPQPAQQRQPPHPKGARADPAVWL